MPLSQIHQRTSFERYKDCTKERKKLLSRLQYLESMDAAIREELSQYDLQQIQSLAEDENESEIKISDDNNDTTIIPEYVVPHYIPFEIIPDDTLGKLFFGNIGIKINQYVLQHKYITIIILLGLLNRK